MRVLLIEDDHLVGDGVVAGLGLFGWTVDWAINAAGGVHALACDEFDAVVLDLGLPDRDGLALLEQVRGGGNEVAVLVLTARDTVGDRIVGLDTGADDYLVKPFDIDELGARLRAIVRRRSGRAQPTLQHGHLLLDPAARSVIAGDRPVSLTTSEFSLIELLVRNAGATLTRARLEESLYGWENGGEGNTLEVHIHNIRKKLGKELIRTVRGVGYCVDRSA